MPSEPRTELPRDWYAIIVRPSPKALTPMHRVAGLTMLAAIIAALNYIAPAPLSPIERVLASAIIVSASIPIWLWLAGIDRQIPFLPFFSLIFAGYYAVPLFVLKSFGVGVAGQEIPPAYVARALELSLAGLWLLYVGYYGPIRLFFYGIIPRLNLAWTNLRVIEALGLAFSILGIMVAYWVNLSRLPDGIAQVAGYGADLGEVGILMLYGLQLAGCLSLRLKAVLWAALVPMQLVVGLGSGSSGPVLAFALGLCILYATLRHVMPWKAVAIGVLAFFVLRPLETPYRYFAWGTGSMANSSRLEKLSVFVRMGELVLSDPSIRTDFFTQSAGSRMAQFLTLAAVIQSTPSDVPYWKGESYYPLLFKPIPRALYPDKPEEVSGQVFGHRYGLISPQNLTTSVNLPEFVELYCNFGAAGVLIGMFLFGLLFRVLFDTFVHRGMGFGAIVAAAYLAVSMTANDSSTSLVLGGLYWELIFLALVHLGVGFFELDFAMPRLRRA